MATYGEIITRVMTRLSAMGGLDVQTYMQPKIAEMIRYRYDQLFVMRYWRDTVTTEEFEIDPVTGLVTTVINDRIKRFIDIKQIIPDGYGRAIPEKHTNRSSKRQSSLAFEPYHLNGKIFRIVPYNKGGIPTLYEITYRMRQTSWTENDEIPFDDQLMILGVCADYSVGEGANSEMTQAFGGMFKERLQDMIQAELQHEKSLTSGESPEIYDWH